MRLLPKLSAVSAPGTAQIIAFGGLNRSGSWKSGELRDCSGLSAGKYPYMCQRMGRTRIQGYSGVTAVAAGDKLAVVDGTNFMYDGAMKGVVTAGKKQMAVINTKIVIFPDKKYYDTASDEFGSLEAAVTTHYITFGTNSVTSRGAAFPFRAGDAIEISGADVESNNKSIIVRGVSEDGHTMTFYEDSFADGPNDSAVTFSRSVPALEHICEYNNRLWGVAGNTIYGSKLGDPCNFGFFDGLAGDSYTVAVGSPGAFTGCIAYGSHICFWKEDMVHKLYGTKPANYQVNTYKVSGVKEGSGSSLCIINETLFFHGREGIYAYSGGIPELISGGFGLRRYSGAAAGSDGRRYWCSLDYTEDGAEKHELMVYDAFSGIWLRDGDTQADGFAFLDGSLYMAADGKLIQLDTGEADVDWTAEFCPFSEGTENKKAVSRLSLMFRLTGWLKIEIRYDDGPWSEVLVTHGDNGRLVNVPIPVQRCDRFTLRLSGRGRVTVMQLTRQVAAGSVF